MLGLNKDVVELAPYQEQWKALFKKEKKLLETLIGEHVIEIQHIGSTAIEGIAAKPMIDVLIGVRQLADAEKFDRHALKDADIYRLKAEVEGKVVYAKFSDLNDLTKTHVYHVVEHGGDWWQAHTFFRDFLNEHPEVAREYEALKMDLVQLYPNNEREYAEAKKAFVDQIVGLRVEG